MRFTWNDKKNRTNIRDHGIDFEDAKELFFQNYVEDIDDRIDYGEERMIALGHVQGQPMVVVYLQRAEDWYHLISARVALPSEEKRLLVELGMEKERRKPNKINRRWKKQRRQKDME